MPAVTDKLIVANDAGLQTKYGAAGIVGIRAALTRLVAADLVRGLTTTIVSIDNATQMAAYGGRAVASPLDERGAKAAVDAIFAALAPDYILLLDGPDVVPHINLNPISGLADGDATIPSDLPYASSAGWSRQASNYLAVTRVVGRLPAAEGDSDAQNIIDLIDAAAAHSPLPLAGFTQPFGMSADVWRVSTQLSLSTTFGPGAPLYLSPHDTHPGIDVGLGQLMHFINCHGGQADPQFYGEHNGVFPVAIESAKILPHIVAGTVAAVECCYGAELYNHNLIQIDQPICMSYMLNGAIAYLGSTNIAYGPPASNGQADLLAQYFLQNVLAGSSSGAALLLARQKFIQSQAMASPANLKTLAQFILLGDPSALPCERSQHDANLVSSTTSEAEAKGLVSALSEQTILEPEQNRKMRRVALQGVGQALGASATKPGAKIETSESVRTRLVELARAQNIDPKQLTILATDGGTMYRRAAKAADEQRKVAIVVDREESTNDRPWPLIKLMVSHIVGNRIVRVEVSECR